LAVPGVPFALSLCLSLLTVGKHPYWQDSGLYLTAIKELGVLYPPGFTLYEVLCHLWTRVFFFLDFTLAVHLFSALCAAAASGVIALATREFLRSRGKLFGGAAEGPDAAADGSAILSGVVFASQYTFGSTAIYAKVYTFYYLMLALLLWRLIRADESGKPRDFTIAALLIGLSWQAHPSAALTGAALLFFVTVHAGTLGGWKGIAGRSAVAAAAALGPPIVLLPILAARNPWVMFGRPDGVEDFLRFILGIRYLGEHGAFGVEPTRVLSFFRFSWEDLLGVGTVLAVVGLWVIQRRHPRTLPWVLSWVLPYAVVTILFKTEVQHDCWFVGARIPLALAVGAGASALAAKAGRRAPVVTAAAALLAAGWAAAANYRDLVQRDYLLAEHYGRIVLENVDRDAIVILSGDDANGLGSYIHRVRGERPDVVLVISSFLGSGDRTGKYWYEDGLFGRYPSLGRPDYASLAERFPGVEQKQRAIAAFINANADGARPIFCVFPVSPELLRPDLLLLPAGVHWKVVPRNAIQPVQDRYWKFPIEPEQIRPLYRRARGQAVKALSTGVEIKPESYERRLATMILGARFRLAMARLEEGNAAAAAALCQSIINYDDPEFESNPEIIHLLGISYYATGRPDRAEPALRRSADLATRSESRATALFYLGDIAEKRGQAELARKYFEQAFSVPDLAPATRRKMEAWRKGR
jgi:tetratricopeptide (TPR) repeat protein